MRPKNPGSAAQISSRLLKRPCLRSQGRATQISAATCYRSTRASTGLSWEGKGGRTDWRVALPSSGHPVGAEESALASLFLVTTGGSGPEEKPPARFLQNTDPEPAKETKLGRRANSFPRDLHLDDANRRPLVLSTQRTYPAGVHLTKEETSYKTPCPAKPHQ